MLISIKNKSAGTNFVRNIVDMAINQESRFTCEVEVTGDTLVKIRNIRLKEKKPYCGNHPNACDIHGGRKGTWLEGADWVDFNDTLNDVLDMHHVDARVRSSVCEIRDGKRRRIAYDSYWFRNQFQWTKDGSYCDFEDFCGRVAPASEYPEGTPGLYERKVGV